MYKEKNSNNFNNNSETAKIVGALLVGAAAGAALGLLYAPEKGQQTRKKISERANNLVGDLKNKIEEGKNLITEISDKFITNRGAERKSSHKKGSENKNSHEKENKNS